jgi:hypothetical protein
VGLATPRERNDPCSGGAAVEANGAAHNSDELPAPLWGCPALPVQWGNPLLRESSY